MQHVDVVIIGQGLAGSTLAWRLAERGVSFLVVDRGGVDDYGRPSASRVAVGLITPITGKRLTLAPGWEQARTDAEAFYRGVEQQTGASFFESLPAARLFNSLDERRLFAQRSADPQYSKQSELFTASSTPAGFRAELGGFSMPQAARLNTAGYLEATRLWLQNRDSLRAAHIEPKKDLKIDRSGVSVERLGVSAKVVVSCQGSSVSMPVPEMAQQILPVHGDLLEILAPDLQTERVVHRGVWVAPAANREAGHYTVGATYSRGRRDSQPDQTGRNQLLRSLQSFTNRPVRVLRHNAAVRPTTKHRTPFAGFLTSNPRIAWLNGLGAKGALLAPGQAAVLANALVKTLPALK